MRGPGSYSLAAPGSTNVADASPTEIRGQALAAELPDGWERYLWDRGAVVGGHALRLLHHGDEVFRVWLDAIAAARERISIEMYIFEDDDVGRVFAQALAAAAKRGVRVRLLYDYVGCINTPTAFFNALVDAGVWVHAYHPYRFWKSRAWTLWRRNHRKILVCDGRAAFTGGVNIGRAWVPESANGEGWHDAAIEVKGPIAAHLEAVFLATWNLRAPKPQRLATESLSAPPPMGTAAAWVVANTELRERFAIRRAALHAMRASRTSIHLMNPYFVPDGGVLRALTSAAARGVDVRILLPERSDVPIIDFAAAATFKRLLRSGVRVYRHPQVVHTKALGVDGVFLSIGSYNFDHRSLRYNLEVMVNALDEPLGRAFEDLFAQEIAGASEVTLVEHAVRSLSQRFLEQIAYALRAWL